MSYIATVLSDLPAGGSFWKLDEPSGTLVDSGSGGNNLTTLGVPAYQQPGPLAAETSYSMLFRNTDVPNDRLSGGDVFEFTGTQSYTLEIWANPTAGSAANNPFLMGQDTAGAEGWTFRQLAANTVRMQRYQATAHDDIVTSATLNVGAWNHVVGTYDGSNMNLYINGVVAATPVASSKVIQANAATLALGAFQTGGNQFDGTLALPAIYPSVALTSTQVATHYAAAQSAGAPVRPVMMWP